MIKNIVFDIGGVMADFDVEVYLKHLGFNAEDVEKYIRMVFYSEEWGALNTSVYDMSKVREVLLNKYPEEKENISRIIDEIDFKYILFEKEDSTEYLISLKEKGYKIYLLSDLSRESFPYNSSMRFFDYIEGGIYSFEIGTLKPSDNNYERLLGDFGLVGDETIFIDDRKENVEAAGKFGIHGIQFTTLDEVKEKVSSLLEE